MDRQSRRFQGLAQNDGIEQMNLATMEGLQ
jgi:hypothetical protein